MPGIVQMILFSEISTIFLNFRNLYPKSEQLSKPLPLFLSACFFVTFTFTRMVLMPYCWWLMYQSYNMVYGKVDKFMERMSLLGVVSVACL